MAKLFKSEEHGYVCELWGASTKHPDSIQADMANACKSISRAGHERLVFI